MALFPSPELCSDISITESVLLPGLFHRGWSLSGSALCPWTLQKAALAKAERLAGVLGCPTNATRELVECLRHRPGRTIVAAVPSLQDGLQLPFPPFAAVVEPPGTPSAFLEAAPIDVIRSGMAHDLPWITGVTTEEGLYNAAGTSAILLARETLNVKPIKRAPDLDSFAFDSTFIKKRIRPAAHARLCG